MFAKGLDNKALAELMVQKESQFEEAWAFGFDAERCDMHGVEQLLRFTHKFYDSVFDSAELRWLTSQMLVNKGSSGDVHYTVRGSVMSGDMDTACGTNFRIFLLVVAIMHRLGLMYQVVINGDDSMIWVERRDSGLVRDNFVPMARQYGFTMTLDSEGPGCAHVDFCQSRVVYVGGAPRMIRDYQKATTSVLCNPKFIDVSFQRPLLAAIGMGEIAIHSGVPILQAFAQLLIRSARGARPAQTHLDQLIISGRVSRDQLEIVRATPVLDETRLSFYEAWGVSPGEQVHLETKYNAALLATGPPVPGFGISSDWFFDPFRPEIRH